MKKMVRPAGANVPVWRLGQGRLHHRRRGGTAIWIMVCLAGLCAMAIVFVLRFLPETKGHSVEEIMRLFEREARGGTGHGGAPAGEGAPA